MRKITLFFPFLRADHSGSLEVLVGKGNQTFSFTLQIGFLKRDVCVCVCEVGVQSIVVDSYQDLVDKMQVSKLDKSWRHTKYLVCHLKRCLGLIHWPILIFFLK